MFQKARHMIAAASLYFCQNMRGGWVHGGQSVRAARNCGKQHFRRRLLLAAVQVTQIAFPCCSVPPPPPSPPPCQQLPAAVQPWLPAQGLEAAQASNTPLNPFILEELCSGGIHYGTSPHNASEGGSSLSRRKSQTGAKLPRMTSSLLEVDLV